MRNTVYTSSLNGYINGYQVFRQYGSSGHWEEYNKFPDIKINGTMDSRHPGNLNVMLSNRDARDMILSLQPKIAFSTGSACTSGIQEPSHVLKAIGLTTEEAEHSFRITVGRFSNMDDINTAIELISGRN